MALPFFRRQIPPNSVVHLTIRPADAAKDFWVASAERQDFDGSNLPKWNDAQIRAGQTWKLTQANAEYHGFVDLDFARKSQAVVDLKIVRPDGKIHSTPYAPDQLGGPPLQRIFLHLFTKGDGQ
jgi:hypothetical protein